MKKFFLPIFFVFMVCSCKPYPAFSANSVPSSEEFSSEVSSEEPPIKEYIDIDTLPYLLFKISGDECAVWGNVNFIKANEITDIYIPGYVKISNQNYTVTTIGQEAFTHCPSITSIIIPDSVVSIEGSAFFNCTSLNYNEYDGCDYLGNENNPYHVLVSYKIGKETYEIHSKCKILYSGAFENCTYLNSIIIPNSVTSIGYYTFEDCHSLTSITIPDSVVSIEGSAFFNCTSLNYNEYDGCDYLGNENNPYHVLVSYKIGKETYEIHSKCKILHSGAFSNCTSLTSIDIPDGVTSIGESIFEDCTSLTSIIIPDSITTIKYSAFFNCTSLNSIIIPNSVTSIGYYTFGGCRSLTSITIPDSVVSIEGSAFFNCTSLNYNEYDGCNYLGNENNPYHVLVSYKIGKETYEIHPNCKVLATNAFEYCISLTSITIADSVTSIGELVFKNCISLTSIKISNSVTSIGDSAFHNCTSLPSIVLPDSVALIGYKVFQDCASLSIFCESASKPSGWIFGWNPSDRPVYWSGEWKYLDGVPTPINN